MRPVIAPDSTPYSRVYGDLHPVSYPNGQLGGFTERVDGGWVHHTGDGTMSSRAMRTVTSRRFDTHAEAIADLERILADAFTNPENAEAA